MDLGPISILLLIVAVAGIVIGFIGMGIDVEEVVMSGFISTIVALALFIGSLIWDTMDNPRHGTAITKVFVAEHWTMCGKVPCFIHDKWYVTLRDGANEGTIEVSKREFDGIRLGSEFVAE